MSIRYSILCTQLTGSVWSFGIRPYFNLKFHEKFWSGVVEQARRRASSNDFWVFLGGFGLYTQSLGSADMEGCVLAVCLQLEEVNV